MTFKANLLLKRCVLDRELGIRAKKLILPIKRLVYIGVGILLQAIMPPWENLQSTKTHTDGLMIGEEAIMRLHFVYNKMMIGHEIINS